MTVTAASDASMRVCLDQILQAEYGGRDKCQGGSGLYVLLPVQERDVGIYLRDVSAGDWMCVCKVLLTSMIMVLSWSSYTIGRCSNVSIVSSTLARAWPPKR